MSAPELQLQEELPEGKPGAPQAPDPTPGKRFHTRLCSTWAGKPCLGLGCLLAQMAQGTIYPSCYP